MTEQQTIHVICVLVLCNNELQLFL